MRDLSDFLAEKEKLPQNQKVVISERFRDAEGKPYKWELRSIKEGAYRKIKEVVEKKEDFSGVFISECVVFPNLKDQELLENYGVDMPGKLLKEMLTVGEYARLVKEVQMCNNFSKRKKEQKEEAKN